MLNACSMSRKCIMLPPDQPSPLGPKSMASKTKCECELSSDFRSSMILMSLGELPLCQRQLLDDYSWETAA